jgi:hypothetical protein
MVYSSPIQIYRKIFISVDEFPDGSMVLEYLPTFTCTPKKAQMYVNIPYMEHLGFINWNEHLTNYNDDLSRNG